MDIRKLHIVGVRRDDRFSPNSVEKDRLILEAVGRHLDTEMAVIDEAMLDEDVEADVIFSMARLPKTLQVLHSLEERGVRVFNTPGSVENCSRVRLEKMMMVAGIPMPGAEGKAGYWLKRGDVAAQQKTDVVYCKDEEALVAAQAELERRGITSWVVSAHVPGDLIKFYGVKGGFFRYYYPGDDGISKFGAEAVNGQAQHYPFALDDLKETVAKVAEITGVAVYGGDAIVDAAGHYYIIDFNDWPSFSRCREEAAVEIARLAVDNDR
uniref:ATP-grasp domain-containing protein n=1 Tax=Prevotella sp. GTC17259 TaxID=3236795 RepID=A0AB33J0Z0_9BACT